MQQIVESLLYNRYPIKPSIRYEQLPVPKVVVEIKNQTPAFTAIIHRVSIHYGMPERNLAFVLFPQTKIQIGPKDRAIWSIEYEPEKTMVSRHTTVDRPPPYTDKDDGPGIDGPEQLFRAIGMGKPEDSWLEVDFNEYDDRVFLKGEIKEVFDSVGKALREIQKKKGA